MKKEYTYLAIVLLLSFNVCWAKSEVNDKAEKVASESQITTLEYKGETYKRLTSDELQKTLENKYIQEGKFVRKIFLENGKCQTRGGILPIQEARYDVKNNKLCTHGMTTTQCQLIFKNDNGDLITVFLSKESHGMGPRPMLLKPYVR